MLTRFANTPRGGLPVPVYRLDDCPVNEAVDAFAVGLCGLCGGVESSRRYRHRTYRPVGLLRHSIIYSAVDIAVD